MTTTKELIDLLREAIDILDDYTPPEWEPGGLESWYPKAKSAIAKYKTEPVIILDHRDGQAGQTTFIRESHQDQTIEDWSDTNPTHHLAAVIKNNRLILYLDGIDVLHQKPVEAEPERLHIHATMIFSDGERKQPCKICGWGKE